MLYFPLVSMVLENFDKLHKFEEEVETTDSPVVDPYSMDPLTSLSASSTADDMQSRRSPGLGRRSPANDSYRGAVRTFTVSTLFSWYRLSRQTVGPVQSWLFASRAVGQLLDIL